MHLFTPHWWRTFFTHWRTELYSHITAENNKKKFDVMSPPIGGSIETMFRQVGGAMTKLSKMVELPVMLVEFSEK